MTPDQERRRREALRAAGILHGMAQAEQDARSPRAAAEAAWYPGHRLTVEQIEALIIQQRARAEQQWRTGTHPYQLRRQQQSLPDAA